MKCGDFEKLIPQLAGRGLIEAGKQAAALRHVETCASCAAKLADERVLLSGVRAVRAELANEVAPAHLEQTLLHAFRERVAALPTTVAGSRPEASVLVSLPQRSKVRVNWKVAAIAAVILLATSVGAIVFVRSFREEEAPPQQVEIPQPVPNSAAPTEKPNDESDQVAQAPTPRRRAKPRPHVETVTEYFPLIAGDDLDLLEFDQVVRVELTPAALREVGLPASYATEGDFVMADLVLGRDGIARAIRFVR